MPSLGGADVITNLRLHEKGILPKYVFKWSVASAVVCLSTCIGVGKDDFYKDIFIDPSSLCNILTQTFQIYIEVRAYDQTHHLK